ncbi:MAG: hypothetical protein C0399_04840 [Syntrophus sp. (in: bacteria)]|nr:hypothetical protein [Syntrophus sp. (in: bacteria)]
MKTRSILFVFLLLFQCVPFLYAGNNSNETDTILFTAESFFKTMKEGNYPKTWSILSEKSKSIIIDDVYKATGKAGASYTKEAIDKDFAIGGVLSVSYWTKYIENFDPDLVLEQSKWEMGKIERNRTEIIIHHKKAGKPAILKMFREGGVWKVGLEETFRTSRR